MGFLKDMHERRIAAAQEMRAGQPVVITTARDYGAEGHEIGKMLSMELGIPLYDNELLVRSAARSGEALDKVAAYDERMAAEFMAFLPDRADSRTISDRLFKSMAQVIVDLAATRSCIIEGRLSDYLLRNNPNHIAVLVTAPSMPASRSCAPSALGQARRCQARARDAACPRGVLQALLRRQVEDDGRQRHRGQPSQAWSPGCVDVIAAAYRFKLAEVGQDPVSVVAGELETGGLG